MLSMNDAEILRVRIRPLVTPDLLARAAAHPNPPYDPDIAEVLDFVRRNPDPDQPRYAIVRLADGFAVAIRRQPPGTPPEIVQGGRYPDRDAAEHAVLLHRLTDYGVLP